MTDRSLSADARAHAARAAGQPQPDLREQLAEALRTAPSVLMDTPEERDRHAANPRNHHISHHYYWGCAVCRGEVDTLADAALAVFRPLLDAKQAEVDAVASRATAAIAGMGADVRQARRERDRYRSAWLSARQRAEAYGEGILRHVEDRDTWMGWAKQQAARVVAAEAELTSLRTAARTAAVSLRDTAERTEQQRTVNAVALRAAAKALDEITGGTS